MARGEAVAEMGAAPWPRSAQFAYDIEAPRHRELVAAHALASRPVSNAEYAKFVDECGYAEPTLWLSDAWTLLRPEGWQRPPDWHEDGLREFTLGGWRDSDQHEPACNLYPSEDDPFHRLLRDRLPPACPRAKDHTQRAPQRE